MWAFCVGCTATSLQTFISTACADEMERPKRKHSSSCNSDYPETTHPPMHRASSSRYWETVLGHSPSSEAGPALAGPAEPRVWSNLQSSSRLSSFGAEGVIHSGFGDQDGNSSGVSIVESVPSAFNTHSSSADASSGQFRCEICGWCFRKRGNLNKHVKTVHGDRRRKYVCDLCGLAFVERHNRDNHIKVVCGGEKPYACDTCGTRFGRKSSLRQHVQTVHEKQRPYKCDICDHAFGQKSTLAKHRAAVHCDVPHDSGGASSAPISSYYTTRSPASHEQVPHSTLPLPPTSSSIWGHSPARSDAWRSGQ